MAGNKVQLEAGTLLFPLPVVVVGVGDVEKPNLVTLAWVGTLCSRPPMVGISVRPDRYSYRILADRGEFTLRCTPWRNTTPSASRWAVMASRANPGRRREAFP